MNSFILNITASSGEFYQGSCESMVLPVKDGVYGVQAGHSPVLVAIHMGMLKFTVDGETREILVGDGIAEVTPHLRAFAGGQRRAARGHRQEPRRGRPHPRRRALAAQAEYARVLSDEDRPRPCHAASADCCQIQALRLLSNISDISPISPKQRACLSILRMGGSFCVSFDREGGK